MDFKLLLPMLWGFLVLGVLLYIYIGRTGLAVPAKGDQVFSLVAVEGGLPVFVGILLICAISVQACRSF